MDKIILRGILCLITILAFSAMAFGQTTGHGAAHPAPPPPGVGGPAGYSGPDGVGHGKAGGHGMMMGRHGAGGRMMDECPMMGKGMMGGPGMMGAPGGRMMEVEHHLARLLETLNLNEQQKKEVGEITTGMKKDTIRRVADMGIARLDLQELLRQEPLDLKAVEAKVKQLGSLRTDMHLAHIKTLEQIKSKLTPEQRKKMGELTKGGPMMMLHE